MFYLLFRKKQYNFDHIDEFYIPQGSAVNSFKRYVDEFGITFVIFLEILCSANWRNWFTVD